MRDTLGASARMLRLAAGQWLFRPGDPGDALYIVRAGRLEVVDDRDGVLLAEYGRGGAVGELALLTSSPRAASVRAARDCDLIAVDREHFESLLAESHELSMSITRTLAGQLRESRGVRERARPTPGTVALIPLQPGLPVRELAEVLVESLGQPGSVGLLDGAEAGPVGGLDDPLGAYGPLLDRCESRHSQVVLVGAPSLADDPWTAFVLQQADRVLALTAGGPVPDGVKGVAALRGCDLVACGVPGGSGVLEAWSDALDPVEAHTLGAGGEPAAGAERISHPSS